MKTHGFTMAEILLSLTIIGVVAAITLPSLTGNINERVWNTQRKALYARFSQAIALMPALNGYGTLTEDTSGSVIEDTAAETFVTNGLAKVLKINNICDSEHLADCGIPDKIVKINGSDILSPFPKTLNTFNPYFGGEAWCDASRYSYSQTDTKAAAFETANGESVAVFYSPHCTGSLNEENISSINESYSYKIHSKMCANFVYDLNGTKGPNTVGKDVGFLTVLYPSDSVVVAPIPQLRSAGGTNYAGASLLCREQDENSRLPNNEEAMALFYNNPSLLALPLTNTWTSKIANKDFAWDLSFVVGHLKVRRRTESESVFCIKR